MRNIPMFLAVAQLGGIPMRTIQLDLKTVSNIVWLILVTGLLSIGVSVFYPALVLAHPFTVDQAADTLLPAQGYTSGAPPIGQGFTPTLSFLDVVELQMNSQLATPGSAFVQIRAGSMSGPVLGASLPVVVSNFGLPLALVHFDFAAPVSLTPSALHFMEFMTPSGSLGYFLSGGFGANPYAGGTAIAFGVAQPGDDFWFREGFSGAVPEPTSLLLLGSGLAGVAWLRRKKAA